MLSSNPSCKCVHIFDHGPVARDAATRAPAAALYQFNNEMYGDAPSLNLQALLGGGSGGARAVQAAGEGEKRG